LNYFVKINNDFELIYIFFCFKACSNCNSAGHISRDCPEPRRENRGGRGSWNSYGNRGGFNSANRGSLLTPTAVHNPRIQNQVDQGNYADGTSHFGRWRSTVDNEGTNDNDGEYSNEHWTTNNVTSSDGLNNDGGYQGKKDCFRHKNTNDLV
jgi:hypothetical protein